MKKIKLKKLVLEKIDMSQFLFINGGLLRASSDNSDVVSQSKDCYSDDCGSSDCDSSTRDC